MPNKFNELLLKPDIIELYNEGITPNYGYLLNGRFEKDMVKTLYHLKTLNGNPITWEAREMEYLFPNVSLQPKRAGSGDPSPENVRPISGYDSVTVNVRGKNLISDENFQSSEKNGITFTKKGNGVVHIEGTATAQVDSVIVRDVPQLPPGSYFGIRNEFLIIVVKKANTGKNQYYTAADGVTIERGDVLQFYYITIQNGVTINDDIYLFLAVGDSPFQLSDFEPYQPGTTVTLTLPETIYGGTVDAVTGVGNETWHYKEFDGQEKWYTQETETGSFFYFGETSAPLAQNFSDGVCSHFDVGTVSYTSNDLMIQPPYTVGRIWRVKYDAMGTADEFKAYLAAQVSAGTPVQAAYKLATPESFQATGNQALTIQPGNHTIYTDGDNISLTRKAWRLEV